MTRLAVSADVIEFCESRYAPIARRCLTASCAECPYSSKLGFNLRRDTPDSQPNAEGIIDSPANDGGPNAAGRRPAVKIIDRVPDFPRTDRHKWQDCEIAGKTDHE